MGGPSQAPPLHTSKNSQLSPNLCVNGFRHNRQEAAQAACLPHRGLDSAGHMLVWRLTFCLKVKPLTHCLCFALAAVQPLPQPCDQTERQRPGGVILRKRREIFGHIRGEFFSAVISAIVRIKEQLPRPKTKYPRLGRCPDRPKQLRLGKIPAFYLCLCLQNIRVLQRYLPPSCSDGLSVAGAANISGGSVRVSAVQAPDES